MVEEERGKAEQINKKYRQQLSDYKVGHRTTSLGLRGILAAKQMNVDILPGQENNEGKLLLSNQESS